MNRRAAVATGDIMAGTPNPETEIESIASALNAARDQVRQGDLVDLNEFAERIGRLCDTLTALPLNAAAAYADRLDHLADDLNALANDVNDQREQLRRRLDGIGGSGSSAA